MRTRNRCYSFPEDEESSSNPSASFLISRKNKKRQRTDMTSLKQIFQSFDDEPLKPALEQEVERLPTIPTMNSLRNMWDKNKDVFTEYLDSACFYGWITKGDGWRRLAKRLNEKLLLELTITDEIVQSCQDYAAELRSVHKACENLDVYMSNSKAYGVKSETKDRLRNISGRNKPTFKNLSLASTSSSRKSYGRKSSSRKSYGRKSSGASDPSVNIQSFEDKVCDAISPILAKWPTLVPVNILLKLRDHICSENILRSVFLQYSHDHMVQFIENFLNEEGF